MLNESQKTKLSITAKTWKKDAQDIFVWKSKNIIASSLSITTNGTINFSNDKISFSPVAKASRLLLPGHESGPNNDNDSENMPWFTISTQLNKFYWNTPDVSTTNSNDMDNLPWFILGKNKENPFYALTEGDIMKLGRVEIKIHQIQTEDDLDRCSSRDNYLTTSMLSLNTSPSSSTLGNEFCRVCYSNDNEISNPWLSMCKCSGSLKYIHYSCLHSWIRSTGNIQIVFNDNIIAFTIRTPRCEICKSAYPHWVRYKGEVLDIYNLLSFSSNKLSNFVISEIIFPYNSEYRYFSLINFDHQEEASIGRNLDDDWIISDGSVSRNHCIFKLIEGKICVKDNASRYGTLMQIQNHNMELWKDNTLYMQVYHTMFKIQIKEKKGFFARFMRCQDRKENEKNGDYQRWNAASIKNGCPQIEVL